MHPAELVYALLSGGFTQTCYDGPVLLRHRPPGN
ncbi:hypothetical protein [Pseudomonas aeruginosa]